MTDPSEITTKEMLDTLEHCRTNMTLSEVQAYAGKWTGKDNEIMDAIRRLILNHDKLMTQLATWKERAEDLAYSSLERYPWIAAAGKFIDEISNFDFGKEAADER